MARQNPDGADSGETVRKISAGDHTEVRVDGVDNPTEKQVQQGADPAVQTTQGTTQAEATAAVAAEPKRTQLSGGPLGQIAGDGGKPATKRKPALKWLQKNVSIAGVPSGRDLSRDEVQALWPRAAQRAEIAAIVGENGKPVVEFVWDTETLEGDDDSEPEEVKPRGG
jgi:hypothetical protein